MTSSIWNKFINRESISYIFFGVATTLVDWGVYTVYWRLGMDYRFSTAMSWCAAVLFAYVTNKLFVFRSRDIQLKTLGKEFVSFVGCRAATGVFTMLGMIVMVSYLDLNEFLGKLVVSAVSLVLNYIFSKLYIFKKNHDCEEDQYESR